MATPTQRRPTATLADLCPSDRAKLARLLRRTLALAAENAALRADAAKNDAATSADARARTATALDTAAAATARAQAAEGALAAARAACVCGACAGVVSGGGGAVEAEPTVVPAPAAAHGRALVFNPHAGPGGAYVFAGSGKSVAQKSTVDENSEATTTPAPRPPRPDLPTLVADVEAALARRGW